MSTLPLGRPIALGRTAEIYAWNAEQVLKLFRDGWPAASVEYEARIARTIQAAGLPVPAVGEVIEISGRHGLIYERVVGRSMLDSFRGQPWTLVRFAQMLTDLHVAMHDRSVPELPSRRKRLEQNIRGAGALSPELAEAALHILHTLPDGDRLLHGDFHPDNILLTAQGPIIIDWNDAATGHPLADVARTSLLLRVGALPPGTAARWLIAAGRRLFHMIYLNRYFRLRPGDRRQLTAWQTVVAAARLRESIPEERDRLLGLVKAGVS